MEEIDASDCPFLSNGKCTIENLNAFRGENCTNETKDECCYTYKSGPECDIGCASQNSATGDGFAIGSQADVRDVLISEGEYGSSLQRKRDLCAIVGALLIILGGVWIVEIAMRESYLGLIGSSWNLYVSSGSIYQLFDFLFQVTPLFLVMVGYVLIMMEGTMLKIQSKKMESHKSPLIR